MDNEFNAHHIRVEDKSGRDKMRGSKYIQSKMGDCFKQVKKDLEEGRQVLFSGTSCQVAGLRCYLQKDYTNLLCVDIVCHGVPSPKVWHKYLDWISKGKNVTEVDFRNKTDFGWTAHAKYTNIGIHNDGAAKACNASAEIEFPEGVDVFDDEILDLAEPKAPKRGKNPIQLAKKRKSV